MLGVEVYVVNTTVPKGSSTETVEIKIFSKTSGKTNKDFFRNADAALLFIDESMLDSEGDEDIRKWKPYAD